MQIPVLIEPVANIGFRATAGMPMPLSAEGPTAEEAVQNLRAAMDAQLQGGKRLMLVDLPASGNPWLALAGMYDPNDPLVKQWEREVAAYRDEVDADPDRV